jgi:hypothetical protein
MAATPLNTFRLDPASAMSLYRDGQIEADSLLRALTTFPAWKCPGQRDAEGHLRVGVLRRGDACSLELYSSEPGHEHAANSEWIELPGYVILARLEELGVQRVTFDWGSEHSLFYTGPRLHSLRAWANVAAVETALYDPDAVDNPFSLLHGFSDYLVLIRPDAGDRDLVLAPDNAGRNLAAIFTAWDACDQFQQTMKSAGVDDEMVTETVKGHELFHQLELAGVDGMVFNPLGALPPVALQSGIIPRILAAPPYRFTDTLH